MNTRYTFANKFLISQPFLSHQHRHAVEMHNNTHCNVDNLSNEGQQGAAVWKLSTVWTACTQGVGDMMTASVWMQLFIQISFSVISFLRHSLIKPAITKWHHIWTLQVKNGKINSPLCMTVYSTVPFFSISMYGTAVWRRGDQRGSLAPLHLTGSSALIHWAAEERALTVPFSTHYLLIQLAAGPGE